MYFFFFFTQDESFIKKQKTKPKKPMVEKYLQIELDSLKN